MSDNSSIIISRIVSSRKGREPVSIYRILQHIYVFKIKSTYI